MEPTPSQQRLVQVFASASLTEGLLVRGLLEASGIPVVVKGEATGPYRMGPMFVLVTEDLEVRARLLIAELQGSPEEEPDAT